MFLRKLVFSLLPLQLWAASLQSHTMRVTESLHKPNDHHISFLSISSMPFISEIKLP